MSVKITVRFSGDVAILDVAGRVTLGEGSSTLRETVGDLFFKQGHKKLLFNLGEVSYIDSSGIGVLVIDLFSPIASGGGQMKLMNLNKRVKDLLQITKLYTVFDVHDDEQEAVASFSSDKPPEHKPTAPDYHDRLD